MTNKVNKQEAGKIKYNRSGFVKYSNKLFPRWHKQSWTVWVSKTQGIQFSSFELAQIYFEVIKLKETNNGN